MIGTLSFSMCKPYVCVYSFYIHPYILHDCHSNLFFVSFCGIVIIQEKRPATVLAAN